MNLRLLSRRTGVLCAWLLALLAAASGRVSAGGQAEVMMTDTAQAVIRLNTLNGFWDGHGWQPVRVRVENRADQARSWDIELSMGGSYRSGASMATTVRVAVPARSTQETVVMMAGTGRQTMTGGYIGPVRARVTGPGVMNGSVHMGESRNQDFNLIAASPGMEAGVRRFAPAATASSSNENQYEVEVVNPSVWPADWRVWSSFSAVVLSRDEFDALDGARRNALREWVAQGGRLWLPETGGNRGSEPAQVTLGQGLIVNRLSHTVTDSGDARHRLFPWNKVATLATDEDREGLELNKPILALILFLVVFGIVVGPLNVFWFAPAAKRQRLFILVPSISLGASLLLGLVIIVKDGFGGEGVRRALVVLVPGENKAVVYQQQVARTGVLLSKDFPLPEDTLLSFSTGSLADESEAREVRRDGTEVSGAWFTSRSRLQHDLRRITPTRARVELVEGGGVGQAPVIQSSLTTTLKRFRYRDERGFIWAADEVSPGRRVTLTSDKLRDESPPPPPNGFFIADGGSSELAPLATHTAIHWTDDTVVYTGRVEAARK